MSKKKFQSVPESHPDNPNIQEWLKKYPAIAASIPYDTDPQEWVKRFLSVTPPQHIIDNIEAVNRVNIMLGGTLMKLDSALQDIDNSPIAILEPNINTQIAKYLEPYKVELDSLRSQLQNVRDSLEPLGKSLLENAAFLTNSIAVQGKLQVTDSAITSIFIRLDKIESDNKDRWNKRATVINILFTLLGIFIALLGVAVTYWLGIFR
jgi:hypothetical protein